MAFKMTNAPFQKGKEKRQARRADNKAYRQDMNFAAKSERDAKAFTSGTKNTGELLDKLANPEKTKEKHSIKKGVKNIVAGIATGFGIQKFASKFDKSKGGDGWIHNLGGGNPNNL